MFHTRIVVVAVSVLVATACVQAEVIVYNSPDFGSGATYRTNWLGAVGVAVPDHLVDFESGFTANQNIAGISLPGGLSLNSAASTPTVTIRSGAGSIGDSNPIGNYAAGHVESSSLRFDFATPVDYVGFYDIDQSGGSITVSFVGGGSQVLSIDTTAISGDVAEFYGIYCNDQPGITRLNFSVSGLAGWGVDNIEFGVIPEPATLSLLALGGLALFRRRRAA